MEWITIILPLLGIPAIISGVAMILVNRHYAKKDKTKAKSEENEKKLTELENELFKFEKHQNTYHEHMEQNVEESTKLLQDADHLIITLSEALQALLRDRIIDVYNQYIHKECMPIYAKESLNGLYTQYKLLNGNGVVDSLIDYLISMPTDTPKQLKE